MKLINPLSPLGPSDVYVALDDDVTDEGSQMQKLGTTHTQQPLYVVSWSLICEPLTILLASPQLHQRHSATEI